MGGLDPTKGREQPKARPCIVVSPDELNPFGRMIVVVPCTSKPFPFPRAVEISSTPKKSYALIEQMRSIDAQVRVVRVEGKITDPELSALSDLLVEFFSY
jgi:mRNA interferase MazF